MASGQNVDDDCLQAEKTFTSSIFTDPTPGSHCCWNYASLSLKAIQLVFSVHPHLSWGSWFSAIFDRYSALNTRNFERHILFYFLSDP